MLYWYRRKSAERLRDQTGNFIFDMYWYFGTKAQQYRNPKAP